MDTQRKKLVLSDQRRPLFPAGICAPERRVNHDSDGFNDTIYDIIGGTTLNRTGESTTGNALHVYSFG
ncbi:hypothetical protein ACFL55_01300 [Candidatus Latescibacterota bacterium]